MTAPLKQSDPITVGVALGERAYDIIMRRVKRRVDRPLLQTADPAATVGRLIEERDPIYQHADLTIWSRDVPHERIVDECIDALHARLHGGGHSTGTAP